MKLTMLCASAFFAVSSLAFVPSAKADTTCDTQLSSGAGSTFLKVCISKHGNVVGFESPAGAEHIRNGTFEEGYAVCQADAELPSIHGYDVGAYEFGFGAATVQQPNGQGSMGAGTGSKGWDPSGFDWCSQES